MDGWEDGIRGSGWGWGSEGVPSCLPLLTKPRTEYILSCSWFSPYFLFFFFLSLFLPLSQAGSQVETLNGGKEGGGPGRRTTESLFPGSSGAQEQSLRWGQKEVAHSLHPPLPLAVGPGRGRLPGRCLCGLQPLDSSLSISSRWNFFLQSSSGPGKTGSHSSNSQEADLQQEISLIIYS